MTIHSNNGSTEHGYSCSISNKLTKPNENIDKINS